MKKQITTILFLITIVFTLQSQEIPIENLEIQLQKNTQLFSKVILENKIKGIHVDHIALTGENAILDESKEGYKFIYYL